MDAWAGLHCLGQPHTGPFSPKALFFSQIVAAVNTVICGGGAAALALSNALDDAHSSIESIGAERDMQRYYNSFLL